MLTYATVQHFSLTVRRERYIPGDNIVFVYYLAVDPMFLQLLT